MTTPRRLVILNPTSRLGSSKAMAPIIRARLNVSDGDYAMTTRPGEAEEIAAAAGDYDVVVACGGDGTVHEVVNGLMSIPAEQRPVLAIVPTGSGNDTCRTTHIPLDVAAACDVVLADHRHRFDLGKCSGVYFNNSMSVGLDALVSVKSELWKKRLSLAGIPLYGFTALDVIINDLAPFKITMTIDGGEPFTGEYFIVAVTNGPTYGSGMAVNPHAVPDDGKLTVAMVTPVSKLATFGLFGKLLGGTIDSAPNYSWRNFSSLTVHVHGGPVARGTDGEVDYGDSFEITAEPGAIEMIVPAAHWS